MFKIVTIRLIRQGQLDPKTASEFRSGFAGLLPGRQVRRDQRIRGRLHLQLGTLSHFHQVQISNLKHSIFKHFAEILNTLI
jgi:hypothetical protein